MAGHNWQTIGLRTVLLLTLLGRPTTVSCFPSSSSASTSSAVSTADVSANADGRRMATIGQSAARLRRIAIADDDAPDDVEPIATKSIAPYMPEDRQTLLVGDVGKMIKIPCPAVGRPKPYITWTRDDGEALQSSNGGVLRLTHLKPRDAGNYTCRACNPMGCAQFTTQLRIGRGGGNGNGGSTDMQSDDPSTTATTSNIKENDDDYTDEEQLTTNDGAGDSDDGPKTNANHHSDRSATSEATKGAAGSSDTTGSAAAIAPGPPEFVRFENFNRLLAKPTGHMIRMRCPATGSPEPTTKWTKGDGQPIVRRMGKVKKNQNSIILEDLIPGDSGNYTCTVCNVHGCINYTMKLEVNDRVNHPPIFTSPPQNKTVQVGSKLTFPCTVLSDLHRNLQWFYRATLTPGLRNATKLKTDSENAEELTLHNITHADEGWYTCLAANTLGNSNASAYLRVVDKMPDEPVLAKLDADPLFRFVGIMAFSSFLLIMTIVVVVQIRKIKHEKLMKHRTMETVHQWTKRIIIVKPSLDDVDGSGGSGGGNADGTGGGPDGGGNVMQIPIVKIEKLRTTLVGSSANGSGDYNEYEFPLDSNWEWSRNQLTLGQTLGEGAFGRVVMAEAHGTQKMAGTVVVAVKMVKEGHTDTDMASLVREMEVMKMIGKHINIINLLGCCSQDGPLYVIVEYAPHGNLKDFLKKHRPLSEFEVGIHHEPHRKEVLQKDLISFAFQVARGMEYLASRRCIHRDLAARNVLVSDDYVVKIADFGLARDIQESEYYRKNTNGRLPIKWMAPESLREKFYDSQSDVWSFGVLLWEIMTYGEQPYPQIFSSEHLYEFLRDGNRMEKPTRCSLNIYMLMRQCWNWNSHERPTFTEMVENLDQILGANMNDEYLDVGMPRLETPPSSDDEDNDREADSDAETLHEQSLLRYQRR